MNRSIVVAALCVGIAETAALGFYEKEAQALLAFTGGVHCKAAWVRLGKGCNPWGGTNNSIVVMDTREGGARILETSSGTHFLPKITRDGKYVFWSMNASDPAYIMNWDGKTPKRVLVDGSVSTNPNWVLSVNYNPVTKQEYIYGVHDAPTKGPVYRAPLNGDVVDLTKKTTTFSQADITEFFTVSSNGKFASACAPWPTIGKINLLTNSVQNVGDGCMPGLAPDSSYWISYMEGDHMKIYTVSPDAKTSTLINIASEMPGNRSNYECVRPEWSNNPQFLVGTYPLFCSGNIGEFCVGKYNQNYTSIQWICITDTTDHTNYEGIGDLWLENGERIPDGTGSVVPHEAALRGGGNALIVNQTAGGYRFDIMTPGVHRLTIATPSGRVVRMLTVGNQRHDVAADALPRGMCLAIAETGSGTFTKAFMVK